MYTPELLIMLQISGRNGLHVLHISSFKVMAMLCIQPQISQCKALRATF